MSKNYNRDLQMRKHYATSTFISYDGKYVERDYRQDGKVVTYSPKIETDYCGRTYIKLRAHGICYIDEMVLTCFFRSKPDDGKHYIVNHKDGKLTNNDYRNLEWIEATPHAIMQAKHQRIEASYKRLKINVDKNGNAKQDNSELQIHYYSYDP